MKFHAPLADERFVQMDYRQSDATDADLSRVDLAMPTAGPLYASPTRCDVDDFPYPVRPIESGCMLQKSQAGRLKDKMTESVAGFIAFRMQP